MPVSGSADVGGGHRKAATTGSMDVLWATGDPIPLMRATAQSRTTAIITQLTGAVGSFEIIYTNRTNGAGVLNPTFLFFPAVVVGALGVPETVEVHLTAGKVGVRFTTVGPATFRVVLVASGSS